jgi:hypothetical protein
LVIGLFLFLYAATSYPRLGRLVEMIADEARRQMLAGRLGLGYAGTSDRKTGAERVNMNPGIVAYICIEAIVTAYVAYLFFQMGRNRIERYVAMRKQVASKVAFMDSANVWYALSGGMAIFLIFRVLEQLSRYGGL